MVNILNVYDSVYGNTKEIAEYFDKHLQRKEHAVVTADVKDVREELIQKADFFVLGCPTHFWRPSKDMARFISKIFRLRVHEKYALVYDTHLHNLFSGSASGKMARMLFSLKFKMLNKGEGFIVEGTKGPLRLGEVHKVEMLAARVVSYLGGLDMENLHTPGFVL